MSHTSKQMTDDEKFPYLLEKKADWVEVRRKPRGHLTAKKRKEFLSKQGVVRVRVWNRSDVERLSRIQIEMNKPNTLSVLLKRLKAGLMILMPFFK